MRCVQAFVVVLAFASCAMAASKGASKGKAKKAKSTKSKRKRAQKVNSGPILDMLQIAQKLDMRDVVKAPQCAVCTEYGNTCALQNQPPMFQVTELYQREQVRLRPGQTPPAPMGLNNYASKLVPGHSIPDKLADCKGLKPSFQQACAAALGKSICGEDQSTYCSKPVVGSVCQMFTKDGPKTIGKECLPLEETCAPGSAFTVGPWRCKCGPLGLIAGSNCTEMTRVSFKPASSLKKDGTIQNCQPSCTPTSPMTGATRRRRGVSGCLVMPQPMGFACAQQAEVLRLVVEGPEGLKPLPAPPQPPKQCAVCSSGGSRCVPEDGKVEFLLTMTRTVSGAGKKGDKITIKELKKVDGGIFASSEDMEIAAKVAAKVVDKDEIVTESIRVSSKLHLAVTRTARGDKLPEQEVGNETISKACKRGPTEDETELIKECKAAGGTPRLEGCLDVFCSVPAESVKCKLNGKVIIQGEVCPEEEDVYCAPGSTFKIGDYATCTCTNGIKALAKCKRIMTVTWDGPGKDLLSKLDDTPTKRLSMLHENISAQAGPPSVEKQLMTCPSHCVVELTKEGGKIVNAEYSSVKVVKPVKKEKMKMVKMVIKEDGKMVPSDKVEMTQEEKATGGPAKDGNVEIELSQSDSEASPPVIVPVLTTIEINPITCKPADVFGPIPKPKPKPELKPKPGKPVIIIKPEPVVTDGVVKPGPVVIKGNGTDKIIDEIDKPVIKPKPAKPWTGSCKVAAKYAKLAYAWARAGAKKNGVGGVSARSSLVASRKTTRTSSNLTRKSSNLTKGSVMGKAQVVVEE